jgi:2'-5' RNA ligase
MLRAFIAIELSQNLKDILSQLQERLKRSQADVKWVKPDNIHLTLKFLGNIDENQLGRIKEIMKMVAKDIYAFTLELSGIGAFPKKEYPRVIWVGLKHTVQEQAKEIACQLEKELSKIGIPKEKRPFSSHITLGRVRSSQGRKRLFDELIRLEKNFLQEISPSFIVCHISLFKSTLTANGPIYELLHTANLKTT